MEERGKAWVRLLGRLSVEGGGVVASPSGRKASLLFARLALHPGERQSRTELAGMLWPDCDQQQAKRNLRQALFTLRQLLDRAMPGLLRIDDEAAELDSELCETDLQRLQAAVDSGDHTLLSKAVGLYEGPFLPEMDEPWCLSVRARIEELHRTALFILINRAYRDGDLKRAHELACGAVQADPFDERGVFAMVRLHTASGHYSAAKREYQALVARMAAHDASPPSLSLAQVLKKNGRIVHFAGDPEEPAPSARPRGTPRLAMIAAMGLVLMAVAGLAALNQRREPSTAEALASFASLSKQPDTQAVMAQRAVFAVQIGEAAYRHIYDRRELSWKLELEPLMPDLLSVLTWCSRNDPAQGVRFGGALERYAFLTNHHREWGPALLAAVEADRSAPSADWARARLTCAFALEGVDPYGPRLEQGVEQALGYYRSKGDRFGEAQAIRARGMLLTYIDDSAAQATYRQALAIYREIGSQRGEALALICMTLNWSEEHKVGSERDQLDWAIESFERFKAIGNDWGITFSGRTVQGHVLSMASTNPGDPLLKEAYQVSLDLLDYHRRRGEFSSSTTVMLNTLRIAMRLGDDRILARELGEAGFHNPGNWPLEFRYRLTNAAHFYPGTAEERGVGLNRASYLKSIRDSDPSLAARLMAETPAQSLAHVRAHLR